MRVAESVVVRGRAVTSDMIRETCALADSVGLDAFCREFGYGLLTRCRFHLRLNGRSYPAKAVLGVAAGLRAGEHFGGAAHAVNALVRLGFSVRNSRLGTWVEPSGLEAHRAAAEQNYRALCSAAGTAQPFPVWPELPALPSHYYASGTNTPNTIRGMADSGWDVGVAAPRVSAEGEAALVALAGSDVDVFCDSGAFSEVKFGPEGPKVVAPITHADWERIFGLYGRLAAALGPQLSVVAPDMVGNQVVTLERLERYRDRLFELRELGCRVLVPMQKGELTQAEFAGWVDELLGEGWWVPALPCAKAATTAAEVAAFVAARKPHHVHLLGIGVWSPGADSYLAPWAAHDGTVSMDSAWIPAKVGKGPSRIYTKAQAAARVVLSAAGWAKKAVTAGAITLGLMLCCGHPTPTHSVYAQQAVGAAA